MRRSPSRALRVAPVSFSTFDPPLSPATCLEAGQLRRMVFLISPLTKQMAKLLATGPTING